MAGQPGPHLPVIEDVASLAALVAGRPDLGHVPCRSLSDGFRWLDRFLDVEEPPAVCRHLVPDDDTGLERPCRCTDPSHSVRPGAAAADAAHAVDEHARSVRPRRRTTAGR